MTALHTSPPDRQGAIQFGAHAGMSELDPVQFKDFIGVLIGSIHDSRFVGGDLKIEDILPRRQWRIELDGGPGQIKFGHVIDILIGQIDDAFGTGC